MCQKIFEEIFLFWWFTVFLHLPNVPVVVSEGDSLYTNGDRDTISSIGGHDIIQLSPVITACSSSQPYNWPVGQWMKNKYDSQNG